MPDKDNNKNIPCQQTDDRGRMVVENGRLYFALGKNMILVSEHFNQNGKDIETFRLSYQLYRKSVQRFRKRFAFR